MVALLGISLGIAGPKSRSTRVPTKFLQLGEPDQEKGREIMSSFRGMGIPGNYFFQFELKVRPRRGDEIVYNGRLWGSRNYLGPISRVELRDQTGKVHRYLLQNGNTPQVSSWSDGDVAPSTNSQDMFAPLVPHTELTLFDLQMPYLYWDDYQFEGTSKILGRIAHVFLLYPPEDLAEPSDEMGGVRVYLDTQYHAMVKSAVLDPDNEDLKTMTVRDIKKVSDQWMVKTIDLRNEVTRDKTRFQIVRAALNLDFSPQLFTPEALSADIAPPTDTVSLGN